MTFKEEPQHFFNDFAVDFTANGVTFKGLLDVDDEIIGESGASSKSTKFVVTFITADIALKRNDVVTQGTKTYKVREPSMQFEDGVFSEVYLTRTGV